jgi:hypothetical protein
MTGLEVYDHHSSYPFGLENKDANVKVRKQCKIKFVVSVDFICEVELCIIPLDVCRVVFGILYMYMRDAIFMQRANQYNIFKGKKSFIFNMHKRK